MLNIVLVAPFMGENMLVCIKSFCDLVEGSKDLPPIRLGIISQQSIDAIPAKWHSKIAGHFAVSNCLDHNDLIEATKAFQKEWGKVDRLIGYLEHLQSPLAQTRSHLNITGMKAEIAQNFRDKNQMKAVLGKAKLPVAKQAKIHSVEDVEKFIAQVGFPIILKPLAGVGSKNTSRVTNQNELYAALNQLMPSTNNPVQAEEFVQGEEHTLETVMINGEVLWQSSTYYLPGPLTVLENPWIQYCVMLPLEQSQSHVQKFNPINAQALKTLGMTDGLSHMEWFLKENGEPIVSEVGARPPGVNIMHLMSFAHNTNIWDHWAKLVTHHVWDVPKRQYAAGCIFLRAQTQRNYVQNIVGWEDIKATLGSDLLLYKLPRIGQSKSSHYEGDGWIIVRAKSTEQVIAHMKYILQNMQIQ